ncbi:DUF3318 domain-containing protein [Calothrix sp. PCC 6303]|uniref:DUF3318 domain-containing protein n=1 Tax=Calothrix sp. PCC 6303 TaxID=1170562 RepID=UPI0002A00667|nr:DUF3318 domain-containing protein [Calothrix sp. PCC 6303]AFZ00848.1 hypothetical protein Cal6303_1811 [Calothrix sp. PCC 6303]
MDPNLEVNRLLDIMPASGRMWTKIVSKPEQAKVIDASFPLPWHQSRPIYINFDLWKGLSKSQRDLVLLRTVSWLIGIKWFKPDIYQGVLAAGLVASVVEISQGDVVGIAAALSLTGLAMTRIWRINNSQETEINADNGAIKVAQRRGYSATEAAEHLLSAIEVVAQIEGRTGLDFIELMRCQNLRAIACLSPVGIPEK